MDVMLADGNRGRVLSRKRSFRSGSILARLGLLAAFLLPDGCPATVVRLLVAVTLSCGGSFAAQTVRYFKEDHLTGAQYIALASDGNYTVTGREHMGVSLEESGRWSRSGTRVTFTPRASSAPGRPGKSSYRATEVTYRRHTFLSLEGNSGPGISVPVEATERDLDKDPKTLPLYVFFEISPKVYRRETTQTYPFRTRPNLP